MKNAPGTLLRVVLFTCVFLSWMWVLQQPFSEAANLVIILGSVIVIFPIVWWGRVVLETDPRPERAARITTLLHAALMILFGAAIIRAVLTYESWRGWLIPIPGEVGLLLAVVAGLASALAVLNLALRGWGAPFALALSRRLAVDWLYAWTRNPMVLAGLAFLVALGIWFQSAFFLLWVCLLVIPALLTFVKVFEERELEIRFGGSYREYRSQTPMLIPRRPRAKIQRPAAKKRARK